MPKGKREPCELTITIDDPLVVECIEAAARHAGTTPAAFVTQTMRIAFQAAAEAGRRESERQGGFGFGE